jgi:hypothetical protein
MHHEEIGSSGKGHLQCGGHEISKVSARKDLTESIEKINADVS